MEKIILTDADGVLCFWLEAFDKFMAEKGLIINPEHVHNYQVHMKYDIPLDFQRELTKEFNESEWIENLNPFADSVEYVKKLNELGFRFIVVTSVSDSPVAKMYRTRNLHQHFGDIFEEINCLSMGAYKY